MADIEPDRLTRAMKLVPEDQRELVEDACQTLVGSGRNTRDQMAEKIEREHGGSRPRQPAPPASPDPETPSAA